MPDQAPLTFLALGDSYTIGESVAEGERWPVQLAAMLPAEGVALAEPQILARTGWTTDELSVAIDEAAPRDDHALVSLLIGVNNQYRGRPLDDYREQFGALLDRAVGFARGEAGRVLVLSIPDWGVTPFAEGRDRAAIAREIDAFNAASRVAATAAGARYVDIAAVSRLAAEDASLTASDGLHPSGALYRRWAELALAPARAALTLEDRGPRTEG